MASLDQDPFGEHAAMQHRGRFDLLGVRIFARSNSRRLLDLFEQAFGSLPPHGLGAAAPRIDLTLSLAPTTVPPRRDVPSLRLRSGAGFLSGVIDANNFVMVSAEQRRALICVDRGMLAFPYHVRYELMEFAIYTLVPRVLGLVPLHGAAVASHGRAVLLTGPAGSGKSTAFLSCALSGFDLLSEDAVFLEPRSLRTTGCANFLHLRTDGMEAVRDPGLRAAIRHSPVIRRRSGVRKFEYDLRHSNLRMAPRAPRLAAVIALSAQRAARVAGAPESEAGTGLAAARTAVCARRSHRGPISAAASRTCRHIGCCAANIPKTRPMSCTGCCPRATHENRRGPAGRCGSLGRDARDSGFPGADRTAGASPRGARVRVAPGVATRHLAARGRHHSQRGRPNAALRALSQLVARTSTRALRPGAVAVLGLRRVGGLPGGRACAGHSRCTLREANSRD